ncbi:hypothetical protein BD289DRAFT_23196 [Coniella lustricola]|uniref:Uncharacterized protein n=1 Tax=Coniella lustricola TaxID=2025994 RepID=A0A2T3A3E6_9PEZI|nr:hypothetical protein BD289DRAFT_23196 [Coniella lustricola]
MLSRLLPLLRRCELLQRRRSGVIGWLIGDKGLCEISLSETVLGGHEMTFPSGGAACGGTQTALVGDHTATTASSTTIVFNPHCHCHCHHSPVSSFRPCLSLPCYHKNRQKDEKAKKRDTTSARAITDRMRSFQITVVTNIFKSFNNYTALS